MRKRTGRIACSTLALLALASCAGGVFGEPDPGPLYHWGSYEDLVYRMYAEPGAADPSTQIPKLEEDVERAAAEGRRTPPGLHAHLAYMHWLSGDSQAALAALDAELALFPESAVFVAFLEEQMGMAAQNDADQGDADQRAGAAAAP